LTALVPVPGDVVADVIAIRRDLHQHPEPGFEERRTAVLVAARLRELGYDVTADIGVTGVVGVMRGSRGGKTIMLRALETGVRMMTALALDAPEKAP